MTRSEMMYLDRIRAIRAPKRASIGVSGSAAGVAGAAAGAPITADQGPLPDGSNLGQQPMPNMQSGVVPGRNRMSIGNSARGNIDLGSFLSARPNQDAINQLAQNPLAQVDPYKATTGIGGFFRRLLGDDANERNEAAASQRGQMLAQKWLMDQRNQGQMGLIDKEHQLNMERLKAQIEAENARQANADQSALQRVRLDDQNRLGLEGLRAVNDLIAKSQDQSFFAKQNALNRSTTERGQDLTSENNFLRYTINQKGAPFGFKSITDRLIQDDKGNLLNHDPETGMLTPARIGGGTPDGAPDPTKLGNLATLLNAEDEQNKVNEMLAPPSALGGLKDLGSEAVGMAADVAGKSPFLQYAPPTLVGKAAMNAGGRVLDFLRKRNAATKNQKIANYYE